MIFIVSGMIISSRVNKFLLYSSYKIQHCINELYTKLHTGKRSTSNKYYHTFFPRVSSDMMLKICLISRPEAR